MPPQVDRPQIVIRQGNSGLAILETEWWGASLADELRSALTDQLSNTSGRGNVSVRIDVQRFDSIPGQYALDRRQMAPAPARRDGQWHC